MHACEPRDRCSIAFFHSTISLRRSFLPIHLWVSLFYVRILIFKVIEEILLEATGFDWGYRGQSHLTGRIKLDLERVNISRVYKRVKLTNLRTRLWLLRGPHLVRGLLSTLLLSVLLLIWIEVTLLLILT
jgi:hypothetical protein